MSIGLTDDVRYLKGVGEARMKLYNKLGIHTVEDLIYHLPRDYIDLTSPYSVAAAPVGVRCAVRATIAAKGREQRIRKGLSVFKVTAVDGAATLNLTFFNVKYTVESLQTGREYLFYGEVEGTLLNKAMSSPQVIPGESSGGLLPVYSLTAGLSNKMISSHVCLALEQLGEFGDTLPPELRRRYDLPTLDWSLRAVHVPKGWEQTALARRRLAFDELLTLTMGFAILKQGRSGTVCRPIPRADMTRFLSALPFRLTGAQQRAIDDAAADMASGRPMNRLVQGDVGSGKTMVAAACCFNAAAAGRQSALMAPTEILAEQHYRTLAPLMEKLGVNVSLLTGAATPAAKRKIKAALASGETGLCIGTHALLTADTSFRDLGLVVTDEQHRFGVSQRSELKDKGDGVHMLVMSATPIPRTLALIIYGDLDISTIDELPAGRAVTRTYLIDGAVRQRAYGYIRKYLDHGLQGFVICPMVEDNGDSGAQELAAATEYAQELADGPFASYRVGLLHGKMKPVEKDGIMRRFAGGEIQLLVATTVVEVGIDVPNAAVMLVENAERFGLSQLHQLRGRIGRGSAESACILLSDSKSERSTERLKAMCATSDGFRIAEEDLKQRGPGDFFGNRQHGLPEMKIADLSTDGRLLELTRKCAGEILERDPSLSETPELKRRAALMLQKISL